MLKIVTEKITYNNKSNTKNLYEISYDICCLIWRVTTYIYIYILCMNYCSKLGNRQKG